MSEQYIPAEKNSERKIEPSEPRPEDMFLEVQNLDRTRQGLEEDLINLAFQVEQLPHTEHPEKISVMQQIRSLMQRHRKYVKEMAGTLAAAAGAGIFAISPAMAGEMNPEFEVLRESPTIEDIYTPELAERRTSEILQRLTERRIDLVVNANTQDVKVPRNFIDPRGALSERYFHNYSQMQSQSPERLQVALDQDEDGQLQYMRAVEQIRDLYDKLVELQLDDTLGIDSHTSPYLTQMLSDWEVLLPSREGNAWIMNGFNYDALLADLEVVASLSSLVEADTFIEDITNRMPQEEFSAVFPEELRRALDLYILSNDSLSKIPHNYASRIEPTYKLAQGLEKETLYQEEGVRIRFAEKPSLMREVHKEWVRTAIEHPMLARHIEEAQRILSEENKEIEITIIDVDTEPFSNAINTCQQNGDLTVCLLAHSGSQGFELRTIVNEVTEALASAVHSQRLSIASERMSREFNNTMVGTRDLQTVTWVRDHMIEYLPEMLVEDPESSTSEVPLKDTNLTIAEVFQNPAIVEKIAERMQREFLTDFYDDRPNSSEVIQNTYHTNESLSVILTSMMSLSRVPVRVDVTPEGYVSFHYDPTLLSEDDWQQLNVPVSSMQLNLSP